MSAWRRRDRRAASARPTRARRDRRPASARPTSARRRGLLAFLAAAAAVAAAPAVASAQACPAPAPGSAVEQTFAYTGGPQSFVVPDAVRSLTVVARGGAGSAFTNTGPGGRGGLVTATFTVTPQECLQIDVGGWGDTDGGYGNGNGGGRGDAKGDGFDGGAGGGSSAVLRGSTPLVVAGGGGGGGGANVDRSDPGAPGGDGAGGSGPGTAKGQNGGNGPSAARIGGRGGAHGNDDGGSGVSFEPLLWIVGGGGGGGGGGGLKGGDGGGVYYPPTQNDTSPYAGGGGGGGSSHADGSARDVTFTVGDGTCPRNGGPTTSACYGQVQLSWVADPTRVAPYGGSGQTATIGSPFAQALQARVTTAGGGPLPGVAVTFTLPTAGASAGFATGPASTAVATTDARGIATAPRMTASDAAGAWTATASVAGLTVPARFALANDPAATATAVTATASPAVTGQPITFTAQVTAAPSTAPAPQGVVRFLVGGRPLGGPVPLAPDGTATSIPAAFTPSDVAVQAQFAPAEGFAGSDGTLTLGVVAAQANVTLQSSANPSPAGQDVRFTAAVAPVAPGAGTPTGTVVFRVGETALGAPVALVAGTATSPVADALLAAGPNIVEATYSGDGDFDTAGATLVQMVGAGATALDLAAVPATSVAGQPVTVTATVRDTTGAAVPGGSIDVALLDGDTVCAGVTVQGDGTAACTLPAALAPGDHVIVARFSGVPGADPSEGRRRHRVTPAASATALALVPSPSVFGQPVVLAAQVTPVAPGTGTIGGTVRFLVDGVAQGSPVAVDGDGVATAAPIASLPGGPHVVEAVFAGDARFGPSRTVATHVVAPATTIASLSSSAPDVPFGTAVTFRLDLDVERPGAGPIDGTVQFRVDGVDRGAPVAVRDGAAVSAPAVLAAGDHEVRAVYGGSRDFAATEATVAQAVGAAPTPTPASTSGPVAPAEAPGSAPSTVGPLVPLIPAPRPRTTPDPLLCSTAIALTTLRVDGTRVMAAGVTRTDLVGATVAIRHDGRTVARVAVAPGGTFRATFRGPTGATARYTATVAGHASSAMALHPRLVVTRVQRLGPTRVRIHARVSDPARRPAAPVQAERRLGCGPSARDVVGAAAVGRDGRLAITVRRPSADQGDAVIELRSGTHRSRPVVVSHTSR